MSRQSQLPPRCPLQKKTVAYKAEVPVSRPLCIDTDFHPGQCGHKKSVSQSSILEEQPAWFDDLLNDSDTNSKVTLHRRSASDSLTFFTGESTLPVLDKNNGVETTDPSLPDEDEDDGLDSSCSYGPNSPRRRNTIDFPEKEIVSAISDYVLQNPLQHFDGYDIPVSSVPQSGLIGDTYAQAGDMNAGSKSMKRHPGQRSRARKLQYIGELERTVDDLQNLGSELSVRIASQVQQHTALLMENDALKQKLRIMQQEKILVDGEYLSLKNEAEKLRASLAISSNHGKVQNRPPRPTGAYFPHSDIWKMQKLDLN